MFRTLLSPLALALLLLPIGLAACGDSTNPGACTDDGYNALGRGDYAGAMEHFDDALQVLKPTDAQYVRAKMGSIEAWIHNDAKRASSEFLALAKSHPEAGGAKEYDTVASKMVAAKKFVPAIEVLDAGLKAHPKDPKLTARIDEVKAAAEKADDPEALNALKGLGYIGD